MAVTPRIVRREYTLPWSVTDRDVVMDRVPIYDPEIECISGCVERYNILHQLSPILGAEFGWGGDQVGGITLAVNILDLWLPPRPGEMATCWGVPVCCRPLALLLAGPFWAIFLAPLGVWGGVLEGGRIAAWIEEQRVVYEDCGIDLAAETPGQEMTPTSFMGG